MTIKTGFAKLTCDVCKSEWHVGAKESSDEAAIDMPVGWMLIERRRLSTARDTEHSTRHLGKTHVCPECQLANAMVARHIAKENERFPTSLSLAVGGEPDFGTLVDLLRGVRGEGKVNENVDVIRAMRMASFLLGHRAANSAEYAKTAEHVETRARQIDKLLSVQSKA